MFFHSTTHIVKTLYPSQYNCLETSQSIQYREIFPETYQIDTVFHSYEIPELQKEVNVCLLISFDPLSPIRAVACLLRFNLV